jgi:hypothetical protein
VIRAGDIIVMHDGTTGVIIEVHETEHVSAMYSALVDGSNVVIHDFEIKHIIKIGENNEC